MTRREFITLIGGATAALPVAAGAQQAHRTLLIGVLMPFPESDAAQQTRFRAFRQELTKLGWSEGGNLQLDVRWTTDDMALVRAAASELVNLKPDVIASVGDRIIPVLTQLTRSIPIVAVASDFLGSGFVQSLAHPGGNITGFSLIEFSVIGKMVETLKHMAPGISRVGIIYNPDNPVGTVFLNSFKTVAAQLAVRPIDLPILGPLTSNAPSKVWRNKGTEPLSLRLTLRSQRWLQRSRPLRLVTGFLESIQAALSS
jgi:ABC-type uncharacterized transport system substrate-binding protein